MEVDVNKPLTNPRLAGLFAKRSRIDPDDNAAMASCMNEIAEEIVTRAHFLSVIQFENENITADENGNVIFGKDTVINYSMLTDPEGRHYYPAFTNWDELRKWTGIENENVQTMIHTFDDYAAMVKSTGSGLVVDPFGANILLDTATVARFAEIKRLNTSGRGEHVITEETQVLIGEPAEYPHEMAEAIKKYAAADARIKKVWLKLMKANEEQSFLLAVDFEGDKKSVFDAVADAALPCLPKGYFIDIVNANEDGIGQTAAKGKPLYEKK